jgi:hypothetical protein
MKSSSLLQIRDNTRCEKCRSQNFANPLFRCGSFFVANIKRSSFSRDHCSPWKIKQVWTISVWKSVSRILWICLCALRTLSTSVSLIRVTRSRPRARAMILVRPGNGLIAAQCKHIARGSEPEIGRLWIRGHRRSGCTRHIKAMSTARHHPKSALIHLRTGSCPKIQASATLSRRMPPGIPYDHARRLGYGELSGTETRAQFESG